MTALREKTKPRRDRRANPFDRAWMTGELAALARRVEGGEALECIRAELFERLWPWAVDYADRKAGQLPAGSDREETRSRLLTAAWEATQRFEPALAAGWPLLLRQRLTGARIDAARHDDVLSRRDRGVLTSARAAVTAGEQAEGRHLGGAERTAILRSQLGGTRPVRHIDGFDELDAAARRRTTRSGRLPEVPDGHRGPEREVVDGELRRALARWLSEDVPAEVATRLVEWWRADGAHDVLPARLAHQLRPYRHRLVPLLDPAA